MEKNVRTPMAGNADIRDVATIIHHYQGLAKPIPDLVYEVFKEYSTMLVKYGAMRVTLESQAQRIIDEALSAPPPAPKPKARRNH